jgi:hypothetical protein
LAADEPETPDRPPRPAPAAPLAALVMRALEPETTGAPPVTALLRSRPPGRTAILPQSLPPDEVEASEAEWRWRSPGAAEDFTPTLPLRAAPREAAPERASTSAETGRPEAARAPLTLAAEPARTPRPMLTATRSGVVQRAEAEGASPPAAADEAPSKRQRERDLDELARQVLPFLKRILAVERERRSGY